MRIDLFSSKPSATTVTGKVYLLRFPLETQRGRATVLIAWIVRYGEDFPRLITCYIPRVFLYSPRLLPHPLKVDISALDIRVDQLHAEPVADIHALKTAHQFSFDGGMQKTDPRPLVRCAGDDGIEALPDSLFQKHGCRGFSDLTFNLLRCVLLFGAMFCERLQFIVFVGRETPPQRCFQQPLRDQIRVPTVRGCGVSIIPDRKTEVSGGAASRKFDDIFTGAQELNDAEGKIGKAERISGFR